MHFSGGRLVTPVDGHSTVLETFHALPVKAANPSSLLSTQLSEVSWAQSHSICWCYWGMLLLPCCSMVHASRALPVPPGRCHHVKSPLSVWFWESPGEGSAILSMGLTVTPLTMIWERWAPSPALQWSPYTTLGKSFSWRLAETSVMGWQ